MTRSIKDMKGQEKKGTGGTGNPAGCNDGSSLGGMLVMSHNQNIGPRTLYSAMAGVRTDRVRTIFAELHGRGRETHFRMQSLVIENP